VATNADREWIRPRSPDEGPESWADRHDVDRLLVPFAYRETNPIEVGQTLAECIDGLRPTAATFNPYEAFEDRPEAVVLNHLLEMHGSWEIDGYRSKWVNPGYVHLDSFDHGTVTDADDRLAVLDRLAATGVVFLEDLAPRFGLATRGLEAFCYEHDVDWRAKRRAGRRRLARTVRVAVEWGYSVGEVCRALPRPNETIRDWMHQHGQMDVVPEDPSLGVGGGE